MGGGDGHKTPDGKLFHGGAWRDEQEWPLARAVPTTFYLHHDGGLAAEPPGRTTPRRRRYNYDPSHPVPTIAAPT